MSSTQSHLPIEDIKDNLIFLKNGSVSALIETTAVNFGLLFETEQVAIIDSFAGMLNSLSFPIQIIIRSQRLDVSSYLHTLDQALANQPNLLLKGLTQNYRQFVDSLIKENEVLDKRFYISISAHAFELGVLKLSTGDRSQKAMTILKPRVDHLTRQLARIGLKAKVIENTELVKLFYDIYNGDLSISVSEPQPVSQSAETPAHRTTETPISSGTPLPPQPAKLQRLPHQNVAANALGTPVLYNQQATSTKNLAESLAHRPTEAPISSGTPTTGPHFVVEELHE